MLHNTLLSFLVGGGDLDLSKFFSFDLDKLHSTLLSLLAGGGVEGLANSFSLLFSLFLELSNVDKNQKYLTIDLELQKVAG